MLTNELKSRLIIQAIDINKDKDLLDRARQIESELISGDRKTILNWFDLLISINHAKLHGLGSEFHATRPDGWGFHSRDEKFLESLRGQFLGNAYGIMCGPGRASVSPLTIRQVNAVGRCLARRYYTLQLALVRPDSEVKGIVQREKADLVS